MAERTIAEPLGSPRLEAVIQRLLDTDPEFARGYRAAGRLRALGLDEQTTDDLIHMAAERECSR